MSTWEWRWSGDGRGGQRCGLLLRKHVEEKALARKGLFGAKGDRVGDSRRTCRPRTGIPRVLRWMNGSMDRR
jgi:hypothetical protein